MSVLLRCGRIEVDDYVELQNDAGSPERGTRIIVPLARWLEAGETLAARYAAVGVRIPNTLDVIAVAPQLLDRPLIELEFPSFGDGRAYSQAKLLRERLGFSGEIRATGAAVVRDQLQGMARVGIDGFRLRDDQDPEVCLAGLRDFDLAYQRAPGDPRLPIAAALRRRSATP